MKQILDKLLTENAKGCGNINCMKQVCGSKKEYYNLDGSIGFFMYYCDECLKERQTIKKCFKIMAEEELEFISEQLEEFDLKEEEVAETQLYFITKKRIEELKQVIVVCSNE